MKNMKEFKRVEFEPKCGERIEQYAGRAINYLAMQMIAHDDCEVYLIGKFNNTEIVVTKMSTIESIVYNYYVRQEIAYYDYTQTDEYKVKKAAEEREVAELNAKAAKMIDEFYRIDKQNKSDLINWLVEFQPLTDDSRVRYNKMFVISELHKAGYVANMNCGPEFSTSDKYADWIIGQCVDGLEQVGAIHPVVSYFAKEYYKMVENEIIVKVACSL